MLNLHSPTRPQLVELLLLTSQRMIPTRSLNQPDFKWQTHFRHALKAAVAIQTGAQVGKLLEHAALSMIIFECLEVVSAPANARTLINDDAIGCCRDELLAGVALLLTGVIAFAFLLVFGLAFGLFDTINDET